MDCMAGCSACVADPDTARSRHIDRQLRKARLQVMRTVSYWASYGRLMMILGESSAARQRRVGQVDVRETNEHHPWPG
jgi:hypothetical protein